MFFIFLTINNIPFSHRYFPLAGGIIAIDPILDMGRTMLNVNGTMVTAVAVGKSFNKVDKEIYNKDK